MRIWKTPAPGTCSTPGGSITFNLDLIPNLNVVYTSPDVPVDHFGGTAYTASDTIALATDGTTVTGTYTCIATYSGDANYVGSQDDGTNETTVVSAASPTISSTASSAITLPGDGSQPILSDTIAMSGAYFPTGTISVTLKLGTNTVQTYSYAAADTTYTPTYQLPNTGTVAGTYTWSASWSADDNNNGGLAVVADEGGATEQTVVSAATPTITTNATGTLTNGVVVLTGHGPPGRRVRHRRRDDHLHPDRAGRPR